MVHLTPFFVNLIGGFFAAKSLCLRFVIYEIRVKLFVKYLMKCSKNLKYYIRIEDFLVKKEISLTYLVNINQNRLKMRKK